MDAKDFDDIALISVLFIEGTLMRCVQYAAFWIQLESLRGQILAFPFVMGVYEDFLVPLRTVEETSLYTEKPLGFILRTRPPI